MAENKQNEVVELYEVAPSRQTIPSLGRSRKIKIARAIGLSLLTPVCRNEGEFRQNISDWFVATNHTLVAIKPKFVAMNYCGQKI